jgi:hypothetical protein
MTVHQPTQRLPRATVDRSTFMQCMSEAARHSELEDTQIAQRIGISPGYMSKFMRHVGAQWAARLVSYIRETNSIAPLQWIAHQVGCEVSIRDARDNPNE